MEETQMTTATPLALPARVPERVGGVDVNSITCCDALTLLARLPDNSVSSVISDPPYGANIADWDKDIPPQSILDECLRVSRGAVVWFGAASPQYMSKIMDYNPIPDRILIWHVTFSLVSTAASGIFYRWHPIYCWRLPNQRVIPRDIINCPQSGKDNFWHHPGTKPIKLITTLVNAFGGDIILDPFLGSGTTAVAARNLGRRYIGCDISPEYVSIARRRLAQPWTPLMFADSELAG